MKKKVRGIRLLIDEGHKKHKHLSKLNLELDEIKRKIKQHAKAINNKYIKGYSSKVCVGDWSSSHIDPKGAWIELEKDLPSFLLVVKVTKHKLEDYLDDDIIEKISRTETRTFGKVMFYDIDEELSEDFIERLSRKIDG